MTNRFPDDRQAQLDDELLRLLQNLKKLRTEKKDYASSYKRLIDTDESRLELLSDALSSGDDSRIDWLT